MSKQESYCHPRPDTVYFDVYTIEMAYTIVRAWSVSIANHITIAFPI